MFQNLADEKQEDYIEEQNEEIENKKKINLKELFSVSNIILYAISFMASMVSFGGEFAPFGLAIFAAVCSNEIPAGLVYIFAGIGTLIGFGPKGFLSYLLSSLIFIALLLIFKPKRRYPARNEKQKLGFYVFASAFIVQAGKMFFSIFLAYDLLASIVFALISYMFYKIFANSITVVKEYGKKMAFTVEEVIGASLLVSIALYSLHSLQIFGLSISNILSIMLVLFLGWKNGMLIGATAGITIGMVLGIIGSSSPVLVASYAISRNVCWHVKQIRKDRCYSRILFR